MSNYKKPYALRVNEISFEKLKVIADANHRSINSHIEYLIEQCIVDYERQKGEIIVSLPSQ